MRTDQPEAEVYLYDNNIQLKKEQWLAHRQLAETIHQKILNITNNDLHQIQGIIVYKGPGSFTGLRISLTVANTLSMSLNVPIVSAGSDQWINEGIKKLLAGDNEKVALPEYGALPNITVPRK